MRRRSLLSRARNLVRPLRIEPHGEATAASTGVVSWPFGARLASGRGGRPVDETARIGSRVRIRLTDPG